MGTRRSRHNKGRKPFYKEHRLTAGELLDCRSIFSGIWFNTRTDWSDDEESALVTLCNADAPLERSADALARAPTTLAYRARDLGLQLPPEWSQIIRPKYKSRFRQPAPIVLQYPYIVKARPEHADLLQVNELIPKSIPANMRADMCQEIMLALLEGRTTLELLRSRQNNGVYFIKKFYRDNFEDGGRAISLTGFDDEDRTYDEIASGIAARAWLADERSERGRYWDALERRTFTPPTQMEETYHGEVRAKMRELAHIGVDFDEAADELERSPLRKPYHLHSTNGIGRECVYCRRIMHKFVPQLAPTKDHVTPKSQGGMRTIWACRTCNEIKADMTFPQWKAFMASNPNWWEK